jgi:hypothetical protein
MSAYSSDRRDTNVDCVCGSILVALLFFLRMMFRFNPSGLSYFMTRPTRLQALDREKVSASGEQPNIVRYVLHLLAYGKRLVLSFLIVKLNEHCTPRGCVLRGSAKDKQC